MMRYAGLVAYGPELCRQAILAGRCANESHLTLHAVLSEMLQDDLGEVPEGDLRQHLEARYRARLSLQGMGRQA